MELIREQAEYPELRIKHTLSLLKFLALTAQAELKS